jgi:hypothetical protein
VREGREPPHSAAPASPAGPTACSRHRHVQETHAQEKVWVRVSHMQETHAQSEDRRVRCVGPGCTASMCVLLLRRVKVCCVSTLPAHTLRGGTARMRVQPAHSSLRGVSVGSSCQRATALLSAVEMKLEARGSAFR